MNLFYDGELLRKYVKFDFRCERNKKQPNINISAYFVIRNVFRSHCLVSEL